MIRIFLIIVFDLFRKNLRNTNLNLIIFVNKTEATVLIIDDDAEIRYSLDRVLVGQGLQVISADSGEKGIETAKLEKPTLIFLDNRMGGISGIETLQHLRTAAPQSLVILMTAYGTTQTAIEAMKHGAFDYVLKPFDLAKLKELVSKALKASKDSLNSEDAYEHLLNSADYAEGIVGSGEKMQQVLKQVGQVAASEATIMITGESGTGKELVARCIHRHSHRSDAPFHAVNCAAIPENLIESELFGHEKGSFTGATEAKAGQFELCHGGTLFLDEIGDMQLPTQTKILRAIQEGEIQRVGATKVKKVDVRLLAATHKNLEEMVQEKTFREDLYYRLNVVRIKTPALRERMEDLPELVDFMLQRLNSEKSTGTAEISKEAMDLLGRYPWPGNVRELENVLHSASVISKGKRILSKDLPATLISEIENKPSSESKSDDKQVAQTSVFSEVHDSPNRTPSVPPTSEAQDDRINFGEKNVQDGQDFSGSNAPSSISIEESFDIAYAHARQNTDRNLIETVEKEIIQRALKECGGNQVKASALLGITRATLRKRIDVFEIRY
ncbi:MAG: DNA-binding response regulator [Verrucomicrobia bacterium TMED175]|nr:MAG: DNA-binding response regulator [Verrucomicrobia bacterium TMED175]|tara:strand:- start:121 stop:1791 length:1671 start_codon:yes stop_codon:yes gene_type:complete